MPRNKRKTRTATRTASHRSNNDTINIKSGNISRSKSYTKQSLNKDTRINTRSNTRINTKSKSFSKSKSNTRSLKTTLQNRCTNLTYDECELAVLRSAVDEVEKTSGLEKMSSPELKKIIEIVENFLKLKSLICYGGTAINNILPISDQFYNRDVEIPDYDFFSKNPLDDAKELADLYYKRGFTEVEAKSGVHFGTYKVFVNYIPVADITLLADELFDNIKKEAIRVNGILYCPPNYLRMAMYLELSRPEGDVSRWEKVLKRITLLNKHYPLVSKNCSKVDFQRGMELKKSNDQEKDVYFVVRDTLINQGCVFFGGFANTLYSKYMPTKYARKVRKLPDFDVLTDDIDITAMIVKEQLKENGYTDVKIDNYDKIGEIISSHASITVDGDLVCFIYKPLACHSFNKIQYNGYQVKVATIDTMLSFYLAFLYANRPYYDPERITCMAHFLFLVQQENRLAQKGLLKRFSIECYGKQETLQSMREEKSEKFIELKDKRGSREYEEWILRYVPGEPKDKADKAVNPKNKTRYSKEKDGASKPKKTRKKNKKRKSKQRTPLLVFF